MSKAEWMGPVTRMNTSLCQATSVPTTAEEMYGVVFDEGDDDASESSALINYFYSRC